MTKSKSNRGVPDGTGPEGKGPTGRQSPSRKPRREDFDSDRAFERAMTRWNEEGVEKSIFRPTELMKAQRQSSAAARRWKDGKMHRKVGGKWEVVSEGRKKVSGPRGGGKAGLERVEQMFQGKDAPVVLPKDEAQALLDSMYAEGKAARSGSNESVVTWYAELSDGRIVQAGVRAKKDTVRFTIQKSQEDFMEANGLALVIIPGELTKAAKLSGVGSSSHSAKLSNVRGNTKSSIPYTSHEERMKLAKMAAARMLAPIQEDEGEHTGNPTVDRKGRVPGGKAPHTNYSTGVSGMDSQAHSMFGLPTFIVKPSELGSSVPEGTTKHIPVKSVRKPKK